MELSILIVSWNSKEELKACLGSIAPALGAVGHEVIVVDNASSDGTADMVQERFPGVRLIRNAGNPGFAAANNQALAAAKGEFLLLLNPDTLLLPGAVPGLLEFMRSRPEAGVAGPAFSSGPGRPASVRPGIFRFPGVKDELFLDTFLAELSALAHRLLRLGGRAPEAAGAPAPVETDWVSGACMLVRRAAADAAGPLDPDFFLYMEELEWCWRIKRAGNWKVFILPYLHIVHTGGASSSRRKAAEMRGIYYDSRYKFFRKHWPPVLAAAVRAAKGLLLLLTAAEWAVSAAVPARREEAAERLGGLFAALRVVFGIDSRLK